MHMISQTEAALIQRLEKVTHWFMYAPFLNVHEPMNGYRLPLNEGALQFVTSIPCSWGRWFFGFFACITSTARWRVGTLHPTTWLSHAVRLTLLSIRSLSLLLLLLLLLLLSQSLLMLLLMELLLLVLVLLPIGRLLLSRKLLVPLLLLRRVDVTFHIRSRTYTRSLAHVESNAS